MAISDWRPEDRPRERLLTEGAENLPNAHLLAVLLHRRARQGAVDLGSELLERFGSISRLLSAGPLLLEIKGLGAAKSAQFAAAIAGATCHGGGIEERSALTSPGAVRDYLRIALGHRPNEVFVCIWLDAQHRVIGIEQAYEGSLTQTSVYPREIVKKALARNAAAVIFAHNHPSGVARPSQADELLTRSLKRRLRWSR